MTPQVHISRHPLVQVKLTQLRDVQTEPPAFRRLVRELTQMLFVEATADLPVGEVQVQTPLAMYAGRRVGVRLGLAPILRAGLGMAEAIQDLVPDAQVWHLGLFRNEETKLPVTYYNKLPTAPQMEVCFVVDPMLATGGSAVAALDLLRQKGVRQMKLLALIAAPEGVDAVARSHPEVPIHLAALDSHLNENKFIVPGLGDAGDRQFGTVI
jgi:uracil phosphoribosyltransferase